MAERAFAARSWFGHEASKWPEFQRRYAAELEANKKGVAKLMRLLARLAAAGQRATLVFGAHDAEHNNAVALKAFLEGRGLGGGAAMQSDEVPTPRARDAAKRAAPPRDDEKEPKTPAAGRKKRTRRASGS